MAAEYSFREFQENQQRTLDRAVQAYQAYLEALEASRPFKGGMHWKKITGREYFYKYRDRYGHGAQPGAPVARTPSDLGRLCPAAPGGGRPPGCPTRAAGGGGPVLPGGLDQPGSRAGHPDFAAIWRRAACRGRRSW